LEAETLPADFSADDSSPDMSMGDTGSAEARIAPIDW